MKFSKYLNDSPLYSQQFPVPEHVLPHTRQVLSAKDKISADLKIEIEIIDGYNAPV